MDKTHKAFVTSTNWAAENLQALLGDEWKVVYVGQSLMGLRFSDICVSYGVIDLMNERAGAVKQTTVRWIEEQLKSKLIEGGKLIVV